ncbi:MAG: hypothetical protein WCT18_04950 [Patescibacteria group bacterium]
MNDAPLGPKLNKKMDSAVGGIVGLLFFVFLICLPALNFWYTEKGVLRELKFEHPQVSEVLKTNRYLWSYSEIMVLENFQTVTYCLDTNILYNYDFVECP